MFVSYYAPALSEGQEDPSKEFLTEKEAYEYIFSNMCQSCQDKRRLFLEGDEENGSDYPACACEWFVVQKDDLEKAENFGDVLKAAGCETLYTRPE